MLRHECCGTCFFYREKCCHFNAPQKLHGVGTGYERDPWPEVPDLEWCGEWQQTSLGAVKND